MAWQSYPTCVQTCQRYWTAGGTLRNIAPGSGRRKSKGKVVGREQRDSPSLAEQLTAAAAAAQTNMFGLPAHTTAAYSSLNPALLAAADPAAMLTGGSAASAAYAHQQLLSGHGGLAGLKLAGVSQVQGQWAGVSTLGPDLNGNAALREHLQVHLGAGGSMPAILAHVSGGQQHVTGVDARALLAGQPEDLPAALGIAQSNVTNQMQAGQGGRAHASTPPGSPPPPSQQQQQTSSPQQPNSQMSQQPSPPQAQQNGSISEDPDADGVTECGEVAVQGRRIRPKAEMDGPGGMGHILGGGLAALGGGASGAGSLSSAQLANVTLPPSMASLAAVMGPGGGPSGLVGSLHPLLCTADNGASGGLLDGAQSGLSRHNLHLALQHHQIAQQQESLQQLNGLLPQSAAALHAHHQLLHGLGNNGGNPAASASSTAASVAALDPIQRSALLQQAAGLGSVGWLQCGNSLPPSLLLQMPSQLSSMSASANSSAADCISLAAAAAAACPKIHAPAAAHGNLEGGIMGAAQMLQAQAAAFAAGGGCGGVVNWPSSGSLAAMPGGQPSSWSLWSSYNSPVSGNYAGYALQAAAAAYSGSR